MSKIETYEVFLTIFVFFFFSINVLEVNIFDDAQDIFYSIFFTIECILFAILTYTYIY